MLGRRFTCRLKMVARAEIHGVNFPLKRSRRRPHLPPRSSKKYLERGTSQRAIMWRTGPSIRTERCQPLPAGQEVRGCISKPNRKSILTGVKERRVHGRPLVFRLRSGERLDTFGTEKTLRRAG